MFYFYFFGEDILSSLLFLSIGNCLTVYLKSKTQFLNKLNFEVGSTPIELKNMTLEDKDIYYQSDPSVNSNANIDVMFTNLHKYQQTNRSKKQDYKKQKKGILKSTKEVEMSRNNEAVEIFNILKKVRKNNIVQQFVNRLKLNITFNSLNQKDEQEYFSIGKISDQQEFKIKIKQAKVNKVFANNNFQLALILVKFIILIGIFYINSLKVAFGNVKCFQSYLNSLIHMTFVIFTLEIVCMIIEVKNRDISLGSNLLFWIKKQKMIWEIILIVGLILQLIQIQKIQYIILIFLAKHLNGSLNKFKRIQYGFVLPVNIQRYWQLLKIVLLNFFIAHILSIVLNLMGSIQSQEGITSWYSQKNIPLDSEWYIKYIWGYYWGTNIMLTVGFGDISAQNHIQAAFLIFIETIACIILAYNISEVSRILQDISQMDQQKKIKFKIFNQMGEKYIFQQNFKSKVLNHIQKSIEQQHQLHYIEENLIQQLPQKIKLEVKRQINKHAFSDAYFLKNLTKKTQNFLAQKVHKIFAHPQEIILKNNECWKILILRQGSVALTFKKGSSANNGTVIQKFKVTDILKPELLSIKFMRRYRVNGDLKSLNFSILNALQNDEFQQILKSHDQSMFQYYCSQRDKTQYHQFDLEIRKCSICMNSNHDKMQCPRMHFIPLKEHIIYKKRLVCKKVRVQRNSIHMERKKKCQNSLKVFKLFTKDESEINRRKRTYEDIILPSLGIIGNPIGSGTYQNLDLNKKIDRCLQKLEQNIKLVKGQVSTSELIYDSAANYKRYFPSHNPNNLLFTANKQSKYANKQKNENILSFL